MFNNFYPSFGNPYMGMPAMGGGWRQSAFNPGGIQPVYGTPMGMSMGMPAMDYRQPMGMPMGMPAMGFGGQRFQGSMGYPGIGQFAPQNIQTEKQPYGGAPGWLNDLRQQYGGFFEGGQGAPGRQQFTTGSNQSSGIQGSPLSMPPSQARNMQQDLGAPSRIGYPGQAKRRQSRLMPYPQDLGNPFRVGGSYAY